MLGKGKRWSNISSEGQTKWVLFSVFMAKEELVGTKAVWTQISTSWESRNCLWLLNDSFSSLPSCPLAGFQKALLTIPPSHGDRAHQREKWTQACPLPHTFMPLPWGVSGKVIGSRHIPPNAPTPLPCKAAEPGHSPTCCFPWPFLSGCCPRQS